MSELEKIRKSIEEEKRRHIEKLKMINKNADDKIKNKWKENKEKINNLEKIYNKNSDKMNSKIKYLEE